MKKTILTLSALILVTLLFASCQKEDVKQRPLEVKKATQSLQHKEKSSKKEKSKARKSLAETKAMFEQEWAEADKKARLSEQQLNVTTGPLTEEEQKFVEDIGDLIRVTPNTLRTEEGAKKYIKIFMKGDHKSIRWLNAVEPEERQKEFYDDALSTALSKLSLKNKESLDLALDIFRTKRDYPRTLAWATRVLKSDDDKRAIPLLKDVAHYPDPEVRLDVARSLLSLGDADTALPILDELAEKEGHAGALYSLFKGPGEIIDERGFPIIEKALRHTKAGMRIGAAKLLFKAKKLKKEEAEKIALNILEKFKSKEEYGITFDEKFGHILTPAAEKAGANLKELDARRGSDWRAIAESIALLVDLKSKNAIPKLEKLAKHPGASYLENRANDALKILRK